MSGCNVVGVQFRQSGKIYDFDSKSFDLNTGDYVVVETDRGSSLAQVKRIYFLDAKNSHSSKLKPVIRLANEQDRKSVGRLTSDRAEEFAKDRIKKLKLDMRLIGVDIQFGGNKAIIYFSAPGRVDFRELVKELAGGLKTRVELKQVGARDEAKQVGGVGICGREFCCSSFLREFVPVSIKMAKNQNLALNPSKVSGGCGRLLCCLTYEDETYTELKKNQLAYKTKVTLTSGVIGDVIKFDILTQMVMVETEDGEQIKVKREDLEVVDRSKATAKESWGSDIDLAELMED